MPPQPAALGVRRLRDIMFKTPKAFQAPERRGLEHYVYIIVCYVDDQLSVGLLKVNAALRHIVCVLRLLTGLRLARLAGLFVVEVHHHAHLSPLCKALAAKLGIHEDVDELPSMYCI